MSPQESSRASTPTAVVTGATGGIGEAITRRLAAEGMSVRMVGRSAERLERAAQRVRTAVPGADLHLERADLSLIANVRDLAARIGDGPPPDAVVSNAAVAQDVGRTTPEGLPEMLAVNHLAPYLLLRSLIRPLAGRASRFVVVGADPTWLARVPVDLDDLEFRRARGLGPIPSFRPFVGYGKTKNMNTMLVYSLARHLQGTRITVNGAHPGIIADTGLGPMPCS